MNVLILTPDRVGSTLLQRLITIYMQAHEYDRPVINLHELTNGVEKYYSPLFNQEVLGKPNGKPWGYYQSLNEITELLNGTTHYKTSRLAHYHIKRRQDTMADQVPFYQYLNDNFFIISAQRDSLLEHALSWCIHAESKKLNVYSHQEKIDTFANIYKNKITVDTLVLTKYLNHYAEYLAWVDNHFTVNSYFKYDKDLANIENYILGLSIFSDQNKKKTWKDIFEIEFSDWNKCHYLLSDLSGIGPQLLSNTEKLQLPYQNNTSIYESMQLQTVNDKNQIIPMLSQADSKFLIEHGINYIKSNKAISELVDNKVLVTPVPIKLQTMLEKRLLIKNFNQCVEVYNQWVIDKGVGVLYTNEDINNSIQNEILQWHQSELLS